MKADIDQSGNIYIVLTTDKAPSKQETILYLYQDHFHATLLATCKVEVVSMICIKARLQAGKDQIYQLQLRSQTERTIEVFSSNKRLAFAPGKKERNLHILKPGEHSLVNIGVRASGAGAQRARIHCVDIQTKQLFQAWILELEADKPILNKTFEISLVKGRHQPYVLPFTNPLPEFAVFEFVSSQPNTMQVRREKNSFEGNQEGKLDLLFLPQGQAGDQEVFLFINDEDGNYSECFMFKIKVAQ